MILSQEDRVVLIHVAVMVVGIALMQVLVLIGEEVDQDQGIVRNQRITGDQDQGIITDQDQRIVEDLDQGIIEDLDLEIEGNQDQGIVEDQEIEGDQDQGIIEDLDQEIEGDLDQRIVEDLDHVIAVEDLDHVMITDERTIRDLARDLVIVEDDTITLALYDLHKTKHVRLIIFFTYFYKKYLPLCICSCSLIIIKATKPLSLGKAQVKCLSCQLGRLYYSRASI